jgi:hypothetical protein
MFTTSYSVLILVLWPKPLVVLTRRDQWHRSKMSPQRRLPGTLQQTLASPGSHSLKSVSSSPSPTNMMNSRISWASFGMPGQCCHYCILSFISLHFKDCKFITGLNGWNIDVAIYISVHSFRAIWVSVLDTELCDKELWQPTVIMKQRE